MFAGSANRMLLESCLRISLFRSFQIFSDLFGIVLDLFIQCI